MEQYRLPPDQFAAIYFDQVLNPALANSDAVDKPVAVFIGGQPGAGKSTQAEMAIRDFGSSGYIHVDADRTRVEHPHYLPLATNPATEQIAATAVQADSGKWAALLTRNGAEAHRNLLIEGTMRVPQQINDVAESIRKNGYLLEARIIAAHEKTSEASMQYRFEREKVTQGYGRTIPFDYHAKAAAGIVDTVKMIEDNKLFDRLRICDRSGNVVYSNDLVNGEWQREQAGAEILEKRRALSYNLQEKREIAALWDKVAGMMNDRHAPGDEYVEIEKRRRGAHFIADPQAAVAKFPELVEAAKVLGKFMSAFDKQDASTKNRALVIAAERIGGAIASGNPPKLKDAILDIQINTTTTETILKRPLLPAQSQEARDR